MAKELLQAGKTLVSDAYDYWLTGQYQKQAGRIEEHFAKRSEERADARNRKLLIDQPSLSALGRARAGLNIAGEGTLPGMSAQSAVDTSSSPEGTFSQREAVLQQMRVQDKQLENDTLVAQSQANKNNAEAEALRGGEKRAGELHPLEVELKKIGVSDAKINNFINIATRDTKIAMTNQELNNLVSEGVLLISDIVNRDADTELKMALIEDTYSQIAYREVQARLAESKINLTEAEVKQCFANIRLLSAQELVALSEGKLTEAQAEQIKEQTKGIEIENELNRRYGAAQRITGMVYDGLDSLSGVVDSFAKFLPWSKLSKALSGETKRADNAEKKAESAYERGYREAKTDVDEMTKRRMYGADY